MKKTKIIYLRRKVLAAAGCLAAAILMCWAAAGGPQAVGASGTQRQLPIYCVEKDYKVVSISFDAAWGDVRVR